MPGRIRYHRPPGPAPAKLYERCPARQLDKNFYSGGRWRKLRAAYLAEHPLCEPCRRRGRVTAAEHVHHKRPRKTHPDLAYEWSNLEAVCVPCHNAEEVR